MALSVQHTKMIMRIGVMVMAAFTLGLAVRLVLENAELEKLLPETPTRTLLLIAAPLTSLSMLHVTLAVRTMSVRPLAIEIATLLGEAALFIAIVSPLLIGRWATIAADDCGRWVRSCLDEVTWVPLWWVQPVGIAMSIILIGGAMLYGLQPIQTRQLDP